MNNNSELLSVLRLANTENVGPITYRQLLQKFGTAEAALDAIPRIAASGGKKELKIPSQQWAELQLEKASELGVKLVTLEDSEYPTFLKSIEAAPPVLYLKGKLDLLFKPSISMVGSRNASLNGIKFTQELSEDLGSKGYAVVSGLAMGIDAAAHKGALETGTIAVLGCGVDCVYPKENEALQHEIAEQGLLMSEFSLGVAPISHHFPRRNRIIAALTLGCVVVEARANSGSMITARNAADYGRDVFAVPGFPYDPRSEGPNQLLTDGATLVRGVEDILEHITHNPLVVKEFDPKKYFPQPSAITVSMANMKGKVTDLISTAPIDIDSIVQHTQLPVPYVWDVILELEISGKVERLSGNKVVLKI